MSSGHSHALPKDKNEGTLWIALGLTTTFLVAEVAAGLLLNSLALLTDAAHMFTDAAALGISLAAVRVAQRPADARRTYGNHRFEILAAAFNALMLFGAAIYILYEAWQRFRSPAEVQPGGMLVVAVLGLVINLISMRLLSGGKNQSGYPFQPRLGRLPKTACPAHANIVLPRGEAAFESAVDIDVVYTPWQHPRDQALAAITAELDAIVRRVTKLGLSARAVASRDLSETKLLVENGSAAAWLTTTALGT